MALKEVFFGSIISLDFRGAYGWSRRSPCHPAGPAPPGANSLLSGGWYFAQEVSKKWLGGFSMRLGSRRQTPAFSMAANPSS